MREPELNEPGPVIAVQSGGSTGLRSRSEGARQGRAAGELRTASFKSFRLFHNFLRISKCPSHSGAGVWEVMKDESCVHGGNSDGRKSMTAAVKSQDTATEYHLCFNEIRTLSSPRGYIHAAVTDDLASATHPPQPKPYSSFGMSWIGH